MQTPVRSSPSSATRVGAASEVELESAAHALLEATETLHALWLGGDSEVEVISAAYDERERAYEELRRSVGSTVEASGGSGLSPAARTCLGRVKALDREMLERVSEQRLAIRDEQGDLRRRRAALKLHAKRERGEPRVIAVKA